VVHSFLLLGLVTTSFRFEPVLAAGIIYIHTISTVDSFSYTLHNSINGSIEIEKNNVVFDGAGNTISGPATLEHSHDSILQRFP
jgi:hypothetical protein